ncbi:MAG: DHH family phosphoesterase [Paenibacillaceae bacterium]
MPKSLLNRWHGQHMLWTHVVTFLFVIILMIYDWRLGGISLVLFVASVYLTLMAEKAFRKDLDSYVNTLSHRVKRASFEVIHEMPIGILLYSEEKVVEWHNPFIAKMMEKDSVVGEPLIELFPMLKQNKDKDGKLDVTIGKHQYQLIIKAEERLLYFTNVTEYVHLQRLYESEQPAFGIVMLDNLEEASQGLDDQTRAVMLGKVTGQLSEWSNKHHLYLRRLAADRYFILMNNKTLKALELTRFEVLDDVRDLTIEYKVPITLSMGIGAGTPDLIQLGALAQSSLDIALGRGGDQAAIKVGQRLSFYGGRSNAVEKRTRVRARVISHALRDLIRESDNVLVVGHRIPDMDAIGAAIGVMKAVQMSDKEGYIVLEGVNPSIYRLMQEIKEDEEMRNRFISPEEALQLIKPRTLVVVVDTHKTSMVSEPKLVQMSQRVVVIDHHRRGEEFINDAVLVYMEPYASSTCELVTELLQYFHDHMHMEPLEATALLAGMVVDTKSFAVRTGARTFEAASFLRRNGADSALIQKMLKEDLNEYLKKADIIKHARIIYENIAVAAGEAGRKFSPMLVAQAADTLLNMTGIIASFVISERTDGLIGISARSMGDINVQVVMERLGGGGHLTNAAAQIEGTLQQAEEKLLQVLQEMNTEEGLFE